MLGYVSKVSISGHHFYSTCLILCRQYSVFSTRSQTGYPLMLFQNAKSHWSFVALKSNLGKSPQPTFPECRTCGVASYGGPWTQPTTEMKRAISLRLFSSNVGCLSSQFVRHSHRKMQHPAPRRRGGLRMQRLFELRRWQINEVVSCCDWTNTPNAVLMTIILYTTIHFLCPSFCNLDTIIPIPIPHGPY